MTRFGLLLLLPAASLIAAAAGVEYADLDLWGRLSVGAVLFQAGHIPRVEDFSFTAQGRPWIDHEWLAGVVFYALLSVGGGAALTLFKYLCAASAFGFAAAASRAHRGAERAADPPVLACALLTLLVPVVLIGFVTTVRAQVFSFVGFAFTLWLLERIRAGHFDRAPASEGRWLVALVAVGIVWGNAHGGFVMGAMAVGLYAAAAAIDGQRGRALRLAGSAGAMIGGVALINPYGPVYGRFLLHAWTLDRSAITEWLPLVEAPAGLPRSLALAALALGFGLAALRGAQALWWRVAQWRSGARAASPTEHAAAVGAGGSAGSLLAPALVLGLVVCMTWLSLRIQPFLGIALASLAPALIGAPAAALDRALRGRWIAVPALLALLPLLVLGVQLARRGGLDVRVPRAVASGSGQVGYPVDAVRWMQAQALRGRLVNPFTQGEFLLWTLYPGLRIAMDGRYEEVYTQEEFRAVRDFLRFDASLKPGDDPEARKRAGDELRATLEFADRARADWVLAPAGARLVPALAVSGEWQIVWKDPHFAVLGRRSALAAAGREPANAAAGREPANAAAGREPANAAAGREPATRAPHRPAGPQGAPEFRIDDFTSARDRARFAAHPAGSWQQGR